MTAEEIKEMEDKIEKLTSLKNELKNEEQAVKLTMNSIYGAIGNNWFVCFNPDVAEAVTLQGQDLIKYSEKIVFRYFSEFWHKDTELHEKLGLTSVRKITKPMTIYGDTDSCYFSAWSAVRDDVDAGRMTWSKETAVALYDSIADQNTHGPGRKLQHRFPSRQ
jgi:DNA polymerase elongation subunit (family B)